MHRTLRSAIIRSENFALTSSEIDDLHTGQGGSVIRPAIERGPLTRVVMTLSMHALQNRCWWLHIASTGSVATAWQMAHTYWLAVSSSMKALRE